MGGKEAERIWEELGKENHDQNIVHKFFSVNKSKNKARATRNPLPPHKNTETKIRINKQKVNVFFTVLLL